MTLPVESWTLASFGPDQRDRLISFWLNAPSDQIEFLWHSGFGDKTKLLIKQLDIQYPFTPQQISLRNELGSFFQAKGLGHELALQFMLANFLLSPPGLLEIKNIETYFPSWFSTLYSSIYIATSELSSDNANLPSTNLLDTPPPELTAPDFGSFPSSLSDLVSNRIHLNRLLGLSNLFYIDPDDQEIKNELLLVRLSFMQAILNSPESELESFWSGDLGDRYWALVRSGIQSAPRSAEDNILLEKSVSTLDPNRGGGFGSPGSTNAFLISMAYFEPGSMKVDDPEKKIPSWLLENYIEVFANALPK